MPLKIKQNNVSEKSSTSRHVYENILKETYSLSGWLLFFYFIYYFLGNYLTLKQLNIDNIPYLFNIFYYFDFEFKRFVT